MIATAGQSDPPKHEIPMPDFPCLKTYFDFHAHRITMQTPLQDSETF